MWGRGLKQGQDDASTAKDGVAPHVGAWIETPIPLRRWPKLPSPPMWGRGLKHHPPQGRHHDAHVAPHVGAWIETQDVRVLRPPACVAPHVGAWIETLKGLLDCLQGCVAPHVGAWIETRKPEVLFSTFLTSPPMWGRGLKLSVTVFSGILCLVAPHVGAWIETTAKQGYPTSFYVAPHVGAWIETF